MSEEELDAVTAMASGNYEVIERNLKNGMNPNTHLVGQLTMLDYAILLQHPSIVTLLLENGSNIGALDYNLSYVPGGNIEIIRTITRYAVGPYTLDRRGDSMLHLSIKHNRIDALRWMLDTGFDPDVKDSGDHTSLYYAIVFHRVDMVALLLSHGASATSSGEGNTLLHLAAGVSDANIVHLLLPHSDITQRNRWGFNAFFVAISYGRRDVVERMLDYGALLRDDESRIDPYLGYCVDVRSNAVEFAECCNHHEIADLLRMVRRERWSGCVPSHPMNVRRIIHVLMHLHGHAPHSNLYRLPRDVLFSIIDIVTASVFRYSLPEGPNRSRIRRKYS